MTMPNLQAQAQLRMLGLLEVERARGAAEVEAVEAVAIVAAR